MLGPEATHLLQTARVATLGTFGINGYPHLVPIVFAFDGPNLVFAVDSKPKSTNRLVRLANIERNPHVSVLVHSYSETWNDLWWIRADGIAEIHDHGSAFDGAVEALKKRYPQYESTRISGPAVRIVIEHFATWRAAGS